MTKQALRTATILLALMVALFSLVPTAMAEDTYGTIRNPNGGTYVNVRSYPSYDADILMRLNVGSSVQITGSTGVWYSIWVDGLVGYINSNFVYVPGSSGGGSTTGTAVVRSGPLNLREAPSMRARVITQLPTGMVVTVLEKDGTWTQIQAAQYIGYVVSSYLTFSGGSTSPTPPIVTPNANATIRTGNGGNLNLRSWAGSDAPILASYANGSRVRVLTQGASWCRVQAGDLTGYMSAKFLVMDSGGTPSPGGTGYDAVVNNPSSNQVLNLRAEPSTGSKSLGQYYNGTYIKVLGVGTDWHRVNVGGVEGYMMAKYVSITSTGATPHKTVTGGTGGFVNLRSGPGYNYGVLRQISNGTAATVVIPYPTWSQVLVRQGSGYVTGYMLNSFLQ